MTDKQKDAIVILNRLHNNEVSCESHLSDDEYFMLLELILDTPEVIYTPPIIEPYYPSIPWTYQQWIPYNNDLYQTYCQKTVSTNKATEDK